MIKKNLMRICFLIFAINSIVFDLNAQADINFLYGKWNISEVLYTLTGSIDEKEEVYSKCHNRYIFINEKGFYCNHCNLLQEKFLVKSKSSSIVHIDSLRNIYSDYLVDFINNNLHSEYVTIYELNLPLENEGIEYPIVFCTNNKQFVLYIHDFFFYLEKVE